MIGRTDDYTTWVGFTQKVRHIITVFCLLFGIREKKSERPRPEAGYKEREEIKSKPGKTDQFPWHYDSTEGLPCCLHLVTNTNHQKTEAKRMSYPKEHTHLGGN